MIQKIRKVMFQYIIVFTCIILIVSLFPGFAIGEKENSVYQITVEYNFKKPVITQLKVGNNIYDQVVLDDVPCFGDPGEPCLPIKGAHILLPQGTKINDITIKTGEKIFFGTGFNILPCSKSISLPQSDLLSVPIPNKMIYSSNDLFPGRLYDLFDVQSCRGYEILVVNLYPIQYVPASGELYYYKYISVTVDTINNGRTNALFRGLIIDKNEVMTKVDNPWIADTYTKPVRNIDLTKKYDLLILTSSSLQRSFQELIDYHNNRGVRTTLKTLNDVGGSGSAEDIREYITFAYNNWGIEYVLIGGDIEVVPAKMLYVFGLDEDEPDRPYWDELPSDLYYACLDGTYNYDGDALWGESTDGENGEDVDLLAEIYIGRAPVDNEDDVHNFVTKTKAYMNRAGENEYLDRICLAGEYKGEYGIATWGGNYLDQLITSCSDDGYTTSGIPSDKFAIDSLYDREWDGNDWPKSEIINRINEGCHIIVHSGHSNYNYNMKMTSEDILSLTNDKYCFIYSSGCMSGGFDRECFAEDITVKTKYGAFAGIWNARYGFFWSFRTDGDNQRFLREFWDAVFGENIPIISKAHQDSREDNLHLLGRSMMRWCYYQLNLFGDPLISFHISDPPDKPSKPSGPTSGNTRTEYNYTAITIDAEGDKISYKFDWDDGTFSEWTDYKNSGEEINVSHKWSVQGEYEIRVKAKDEFGAESDWSEPLSVGMQKDKSTNKIFLNFVQRLFNQFPRIVDILQLLLLL